jgi:VanZ family protein
MIRNRIPGLICMAVLCGILILGLWPFHRPPNQVAWLGAENGLRLGGYGTILSSGTFQTGSGQEQASCSLEIWLQAELVSDSNTFLSFSSPENPLRFSLHQYSSNVILKRESTGGQPRTEVIGIEGVFRQIRPRFLTITSSIQGTEMYVDGALARAFPGFRLGKDFTGQLVIGTSPVRTDGWAGQLRGLAIYDRELTASQVAKHYETWTMRGAPELFGDEQVTALYLFNEHTGNVVHNALHPGIDLYIPKRFSLLHQTFLKPFWKEFKPGWSYVRDTLMNIVGFLPLGFFFYAYWTSARPIKSAALATVVWGLAVSFTIEILQSYLPTRNSGTTDLLTNTFGTFLGVRLYGSRVSQTLLARVYKSAITS